MTGTIRLDNGVLRAELSPLHGAGLASLAFRGIELLHPVPIRGFVPPVELGSIVLIPWSNRISGGGFRFAGQFHPLQPNRQGEQFPIHGNGFTSAWTLIEQSATAAELHLVSKGPGPYTYEATMRYALQDATIEMALTVVNRAPIPLPYGLGFHPWLRRSPGTTLHAPATTLWLQRPDNLPDRPVAVDTRPDWNFSSSKGLPPDPINNGFVGWNRVARVVWPELATAMSIEASETLSTYILYSPSAEAPFFCFEPVTHPIDAHNLPGGPASNGLIVLAEGEQMEVWCTMTAASI